MHRWVTDGNSDTPTHSHRSLSYSNHTGDAHPSPDCDTGALADTARDVDPSNHPHSIANTLAAYARPDIHS